MQTHNEWRDLGLQLADAFDAMVAHGARARLHAQAAFVAPAARQGADRIRARAGDADTGPRGRSAARASSSTRRRSRVPARPS